MLKRFFHLNLNCKNFDRSLAFYKMLGFKVVRDIGEGGGKVFERGFHIPNNTARAAMLALSDDPAAAQLDSYLEDRKPEQFKIWRRRIRRRREDRRSLG
jgi:glyoxylase I family protein